MQNPVKPREDMKVTTLTMLLSWFKFLFVPVIPNDNFTWNAWASATYDPTFWHELQETATYDPTFWHELQETPTVNLLI